MMGSILFDTIVKPLVLMIEVIYTLAYRLIVNAGAAIIAVSIAVNFLILPLYKRADALQDEERDKQKEMSHWVEHIRRTFKGDERYMLLSTYYRQQNYHPLYALKSSISLLLQVPFFMAAYSYLSNLYSLREVPFLFIRDLSAPDALFTVGGFTVNILPIAMTLINFVSGYIYTKGFPLKSKIQLYALALLFLVILYNSPSGLVLYWTMNNVFSLAKNIFYKVLKNPDKTARNGSAAAGCAFLLFMAATGRIGTAKRLMLTLGITLVTFLPMFFYLVRRRRPEGSVFLGKMRTAGDSAVNGRIFLMGALLLSVTAGLLIPLDTISASPSEFFNFHAYVNPMTRYALSNTCVVFGLAVLWCGIFYLLAGEKSRWIFAFLSVLVSGTALINYMFFGKHLGTLLSNLQLDQMPVTSRKEILVNAAILLLLLLLTVIIWLKKKELLIRLCAVLILACLVLAGRDAVRITRHIGEVEELVPAAEAAPAGEPGILPLSRNGKNVIVLMLDKAISDFVPYILNEKPELKTEYDGFVYYPNTISHGKATNTGCPGIFGGYAYTPTRMNERKDELLKDKHNEALLTMPTLFGEAGWQVTVTDPPYANYEWIPDLSIYDGMKNVKAYIANGRYSQELDAIYRGFTVSHVRRNFFWYSVMKCVPSLLRTGIYDEGNYLSEQSAYSEPTEEFISAYGTLCHLPYMTKIVDDGNSMLLMQNTTTHEQTGLQLPDYTPTPFVDNTKLEDPSRFTLDGKTLRMEEPEHYGYYYVNMAAFLRLGEWFAFMKENGVYDNTRIILVADHGRDLMQVEDLLIDERLDAEQCHPLLMVKDFDAHGEVETSDEFMTNADTPSLAMEGIVENPVSPFTGEAISTEEKTAHDQIITTSRNWDTDKNNGYTFDTSDGYWYSVHDNIWDRNNWTYLGPGEKGIAAK